MAKPTVTVDVRGDTKPLRREIDKVAGKKVSLNLDSKNFSAPLGKIRGELGEFDKSLAASNARVLAFGASAGAIYALQRALSETVKSTIAVEKALSEVNVILGASQKQLASFGNELFNVAKQTGRSFNDVALAAGELARQGLGMEETLKRTSDAMQLARLSGLGVEASVNAITAALNGFRNAALTSTAVIDKIIAVDQAFAVSGADLAEALRRVGSTAEGAGVSLNELLGIVTAAQQITARGGAVIGNSFKTIFTRIQRPRVLQALDDLGVKTKSASGASLSAIQVLKNLAGTFDTLGDAQKAQIAELVGGVFQINVLKASLRDLGSQYSVFASATDIASKSSGEAARRNAALNKTLSAGLNETLQNLTKLAAGIGKLTLEPAIRNVLDIINSITERINLGETEGAGQSIGQALLGGLGKFLSGPGLAIAAVALFQLFNNLRKFAVDAFRTFTGLNATFKQQQQLQQGIVNILQQNPKILAQIQRGEISVDQAAKQILGSYKGLNAELVSMNNLAAQLATTMSKAGASVGALTPGGPVTIKKGKKAATGYVPNFADQGEVAAMALSGMYTKSQMANPQTRRGRIHDGQGGSFMASYNGHEKRKDVIGPNGKKGTIIASPAMQKALAQGYVPNFAERDLPRLGAEQVTVEDGRDKRGRKKYKPSGNALTLINSGDYSLRNLLKSTKVASAGLLDDVQLAIANQKGAKGKPVIDLQKKVGIIASKFGGTNLSLSTDQAETAKFLGVKATKGSTDRKAVTNLHIARPKNLKGDGIIDEAISTTLRGPIAKAITSVAKQLFSPNERELPNVAKVNKYLDSPAGREKLSLTAGNIFEDAINAGINLKDKSAGQRWDYRSSDFSRKGNMLKALVGDQMVAGFQKAGVTDAKLTFPPSNIAEMRAKLFNTGDTTVDKIIRDAFGKKTGKGKRKAMGYVPNFAGGLRDAIERENQAGVTKGAIRVGQDKRFANRNNPFGLAVTNTRDEPRGIKDVLAQGYIPNFAKEKPAGKGGKGKNVGDASGKLFAAMMAASLVTSTFASAGEQSTEAMKSFTAGLNAAVTGLSVLGTAAMVLPGPMGIVAGALGGLAIAITSYSNAMGAATAAQKKNSEALNAATVALQAEANSIQGAQQALSAYQEALKGSDPQQIIAAQKNYAAALNKLTPQLQASLAAEPDKKKKQDILGEAASKTGKRQAESAEAEADQKAIIDKLNELNKEKNQKALIVVVGVIAGLCAAILATSKLSKMGRKADKRQRKFDKKEGTRFTKKGTVDKRQKKLIERRNKVAGVGGRAGQAFNSMVAKLGKTFSNVVSKLRPFINGLSKLVRFGGPAAAVIATAAASITIFPKILGKIADGFGYIFKDLLGNIPVIGGLFKGIGKGLLAAGAYMKEAGEEGIKLLKGLGGWISQTFKKFKGFLGLDFDTSEAEANLASKYKGEDVSMGITDKGRKQMEADAQNLFDRIDLSKLNSSALAELRKAGAEGEEALKAKLVELGVDAKEAAVYVDGAGDATYALALQIQTLKTAADASAASIQRMEAALAANAAAQAAANAAIEQTNGRAKAFGDMVRLMAKGLQDTRKRAAQFNRTFATELLKGGAGLAKQFQTSFQSTKLEGDIKKIEINNKAALQSEKIREKGNKSMFDAVNKNKEIAAIFEKVNKGGVGGSTPAEKALVNQLQNAQISLAGQGAGGVFAGLESIINAAKQPGGALEGKNIDFASSSEILTALQTQNNAMVEAEQTRRNQLRMADLQTRLAQEQNRIDMQAKAGGGIKTFLDPSSMDKMESGFNQAVKDFELASGRGDTVKTGQAAGNLLANLNEFMGGPMMGEGAEGLKDLTEKGLAQSLKGRAFARADVLDQAAAKTGNQDLAKAADALRNQDFGAMAATQVAMEFKRQKMPENIENMLKVQEQLATLQQADAQANATTARNTATIAQNLTGGAFAAAAAQVVAGLPAPEVTGLSEITTALNTGATAMQAAAQAIASSAQDQQKAEEIKDLANKRQEAAADLEAFVKTASKDGIDENERVKIEGMIANMAGITTAIGGRIDSLSPGAQQALGQDFLDAEAARRQANELGGLTSGTFDSSGLSPSDLANLFAEGGISPVVENALEQLAQMGPTATHTMTDADKKAERMALTSGSGIARGGGISHAEFSSAREDIMTARDAMKRAFEQAGGGKEGQQAALAAAQVFLRQAEREFKTGPAINQDIEQVEIAAIREMIKTLETTGGMRNVDNEKFLETFQSQLAGGLTAEVPISITLQTPQGEEVRIMQQQINLLLNQDGQDEVNTAANTIP